MGPPRAPVHDVVALTIPQRSKYHNDEESGFLFGELLTGFGPSTPYLGTWTCGECEGGFRTGTALAASFSGLRRGASRTSRCRGFGLGLPDGACS